MNTFFNLQILYKCVVEYCQIELEFSIISWFMYSIKYISIHYLVRSDLDTKYKGS